MKKDPTNHFSHSPGQVYGLPFMSSSIAVFAEVCKTFLGDGRRNASRRNGIDDTAPHLPNDFRSSA
jgi:hypothetical protein